MHCTAADLMGNLTFKLNVQEINQQLKVEMTQKSPDKLDGPRKTNF